MPLHCDARKFSDDVHSKMEQLWEDDVLAHYELELVLGTTDKRFLLDKHDFPLVVDQEKFQTSLLAKVVSELDPSKRKFSIGFGKDNNNVWDYMVDVCFFSYLLSTKVLPLKIKEPEKLTAKDFKDRFMDEFKNASIAILLDAIDSVARIWFHTWKEYYKID